MLYLLRQGPASVVNRKLERARSMEKSLAPLSEAARAMKMVHTNCLDADRAMESAAEPLIMMAKQMAMARMWYSYPSPFWVPYQLAKKPTCLWTRMTATTMLVAMPKAATR